MNTIQTIKTPLCFEVIPCNNADNVLLQDNAILLFLHSESLIESFVFHDLSYILKHKLEPFLFLIYKMLRAIVGLFFSNAFPACDSVSS